MTYLRHQTKSCSIEALEPTKHDNLAVTTINPFRETLALHMDSTGEMHAIPQSAAHGGKICKRGKSRAVVEQEVLEPQNTPRELHLPQLAFTSIIQIPASSSGGELRPQI
ncbi:unnamed protein product [Pleuronectes platessa]|uniref:Uncharacterized protein n=1 Tax=Pleuronectes platessa TaxID=8262 RepID=A0A9N7U647_PLEPL|nr:unnamed protein product [Pleuronectes platessa]